MGQALFGCLLMQSKPGAWQHDRHGGAAINNTRSANATIMHLDDRLCNCQPEARTTIMLLARLVGAVEPFKNPGQHLGRNPNTSIGHLHANTALLARIAIS